MLCVVMLSEILEKISANPRAKETVGLRIMSASTSLYIRDHQPKSFHVAYSLLPMLHLHQLLQGLNVTLYLLGICKKLLHDPKLLSKILNHLFLIVQNRGNFRAKGGGDSLLKTTKSATSCWSCARSARGDTGTIRSSRPSTFGMSKRPCFL